MSLTSVLVSSILFAQTGTPAGTSGDLPSLFERLRYGIVQVGVLKTPKSPPNEIERWAGTGFLVGDQCTFVTARHVVEGNEDRLVLKFYVPGEKDKVTFAKSKILHVPEWLDLAFLKLDGDKCKYPTLPPLRIRASRSLPGLNAEAVVVIGYPEFPRDEGAPPQTLAFPIARSGIIASADHSWEAKPPAPKTPTLILDLPAVPGLSGSPVILQSTGEVVGVVKGMGIDPRGDFSFATPLDSSLYFQAITKGREPPTTPTAPPQ